MSYEIYVEVPGLPPAKNEALSMLAPGRAHAQRVISLLQAARVVMARAGFSPFAAAKPIGLEVVVYAEPGKDPWDATNYLGGIGDVLEDKSHRGRLEHIGDLASVFVYANDRQIREIHYRMEPKLDAHYTIRIWESSTERNTDGA